VLPVDRRGDAVVDRELQGIDHSQDFREVSASAGWVQEGELELLVGADDEHSPASHGQPSRILLIWVEHAIQGGQLATRVCDDWVGYLGLGTPLSGLDVFDPPQMGFRVVAGKRGDLHPPLLELGHERGDGPQLGGADWGVVRRVAEEDRPAALYVLVPLDRAVGRLRLEVGNLIPKADGHGWRVGCGLVGKGEGLAM